MLYNNYSNACKCYLLIKQVSNLDKSVFNIFLSTVRIYISTFSRQESITDLSRLKTTSLTCSQSL